MAYGIYGLRKWFKLTGQTIAGTADALAPIGVSAEDDTIAIHAIPTFTESATFSLGTGETITISGTCTTALTITAATTTGVHITGASSGACIQVGTSSASPLAMAQAEDFVLAIYTTCADTDGANTAKPIYIESTYSGAGQVARCMEAKLLPTAQLGGWCNAIKGYTAWSTTAAGGGSTGLASAICAEMRLPNGACAGAFYPLEVEWVGQANTAFGTPGSGSQSGFIYLAASGTVTDLNADGVFFSVTGLTAGATSLLSTNSQTLKCNIGSSTTRYLVLSQATDSLSLNSCATAITLGDNVTTTGIQIGNVPTGILLDGNFTDAIKIAGSNTITDGIEIGVCATNAINIAAQTTIGIKMAGDAAYIPIQIGTKANTATGGLNMNGQDSYDEHGGITMFCDDGGVALAQTYTTSAIWTRYLITVSQTSNTHTAAYLQMKSLAATYTTCDTSAAKIYFETAGAVTLASGNLSCINACLELGGAFTDTAEALSGIDININDGTNALSTAKASTGLRIRKTSGSTAGFPIGIGIEDVASTIGIKIGSCTTSINIGACTTGITIGNAPTCIVNTDVGATGEHFLDMVDAYLGIVIETGSYSSEGDKGVTVTSTNSRPVSFLFDDSGSALGAGDIRPTLSRMAFTIDQTTAECRFASLRGHIKAASGVDFSGDTSEYYATQGLIECAGATTIGAGAFAAGVCGMIWADDTFTGTGLAAGVMAKLYQTSGSTTTTSAFVACKWWNSGDTWSYGLYIQDSSVDVGCDIRLNAGALIGAGTAAPTHSAVQGSLYIRTGQAQNATLYMNTDGATSWTLCNSIQA